MSAETTGKHHQHNYKSAIHYKAGTHKSLLKRLKANKTVGPFSWTGDVSDLPFTDCAVNPIGAVPYKYDLTRARACDDPFINAAIKPPGFRMTAMQQLRDRAFPYCCWLKSDIASAFLCMQMAQHDMPWMMFAWHHPNNTDF